MNHHSRQKAYRRWYHRVPFVQLIGLNYNFNIHLIVEYLSSLQMRATYRLIQYPFPRLNFIAFYFNSINQTDSIFHRNLTKKIMGSDENQLLLLFQRYKKRMNIYNMSAVLKKMTKFHKPNPELSKTVFEELSIVIYQFGNQDIQADRVRVFSNMICYVGNLKYLGLNDMLSKIKYEKIIAMSHHKQFVMLITGLLKLSLIEKCVERQQLKQTIKEKMLLENNVGLIISMWRNLIKHQQSDEELNEYFIKLITQKKLKEINLKDYGYLVYSFLQTYSPSRKNEDFITLLKNYPNKMMYSTRINIYQLCILIDNLEKLKQIVNMNFQNDFIDLICNHYQRNINMKNINLRHLANGFDSIIRFFKEPSINICLQTKNKFLTLLGKEEHLDDHQSITSLFVQLTLQIKEEPDPEEVFLQPQISNLQNQASMVEAVTKALSPFASLQNKHFQKYIYGLYLHKVNEPQFYLNKETETKILGEVMKRTFSYQQIQSIVPFLWIIGIRNRQLCNFFRGNLQEFRRNGLEQVKLEKRLKDKCLMSDKGCLGCI